MDSFITRIGGKKLLRDQIIARFPTNFDRYIEVFGGAGWVLFRKDKHADLEVYNDFDQDLTNLFRCIKYHAPELQRELDWSLNSREFFYDARAQQQVQGLTDIQRAARFFLLIKYSYGADQHSFSCTKRSTLPTIDDLKTVQERLDGVVIECKDYEDLIKQYDRLSALLYLDPPYWGTEDYYKGFAAVDHDRLYEVLHGIKGRFILSYNDCPKIREMYAGYNITEVSRCNNLRARYKDKEPYNELIITNY
ncbi:MAG TPA: DNA adenine methylase [Clostridia bacterium]|nr:DNA adenine methylase [Clostridia bacterium]